VNRTPLNQPPQSITPSPTTHQHHTPILVPVVDLLGGQVVHARRGERSQYQPIRSPLCPGSDLLPLARALRQASGSALLYAADLDALQGRPVQEIGRASCRERVS
jgi:uncharacterized protein related to proFAR isomerase